MIPFSLMCVLLSCSLTYKYNLYGRESERERTHAREKASRDTRLEFHSVLAHIQHSHSTNMLKCQGDVVITIHQDIIQVEPCLTNQTTTPFQLNPVSTSSLRKPKSAHTVDGLCKAKHNLLFCQPRPPISREPKKTFTWIWLNFTRSNQIRQ